MSSELSHHSYNLRKKNNVWILHLRLDSSETETCFRNVVILVRFTKALREHDSQVRLESVWERGTDEQCDPAMHPHTGYPFTPGLTSCILSSNLNIKVNLFEFN